TERAAHGLEVDSRDRLEAVEAATHEQKRLVLSHTGPHRAQLAAEAQALTQQPRLRVTPSIPRVGELQRHKIEPGKIRSESLDGLGGVEADSEPARPVPPALALGAQLGERHDERITRRDLLAQVAPGVNDDLTPPQDVPHTRAP